MNPAEQSDISCRSLYRELLLAWAEADLPEDDLQRRRKEPDGRTLPEIWASLNCLNH